jgi:hypothetical protein
VKKIADLDDGDEEKIKIISTHQLYDTSPPSVFLSFFILHLFLYLRAYCQCSGKYLEKTIKNNLQK